MTGRPTSSARTELEPVGPQIELLGPWWTFDAPTLRVADRNQEYVSIWSAGDAGRSVLLISAVGEDHRVWEPALSILTEHLVVHALDVRSRAHAMTDTEGVRTALAAVGADAVITHGPPAPDLKAVVTGFGIDQFVVWDGRTSSAEDLARLL